MQDVDVDAMSILIANDHIIVRDAVCSVLEKEPGLTVSVADSYNSVMEALVGGKSYDIILLDIFMPGMDGIASIKSVVAANPGGNIVVFSGSVMPDFVLLAIRGGARGYVPKTLPLKALVSTLRLIQSGQVFLPMSFLSENGSYGGQNGGDSSIPELSSREMCILRFLSAGKTNKEIAREVQLSEVTVKMHMRSIFSKLGASNRTHAVVLAKSKFLI